VYYPNIDIRSVGSNSSSSSFGVFQGNVFSFNEIQVSLASAKLSLTLSSSIVELKSDRYNLFKADFTFGLAASSQLIAESINLFIIISSGVSD
jgi:hypothetical protein